MNSLEEIRLRKVIRALRHFGKPAMLNVEHLIVVRNRSGRN